MHDGKPEFKGNYVQIIKNIICKTHKPAFLQVATCPSNEICSSSELPFVDRPLNIVDNSSPTLNSRGVDPRSRFNTFLALGYGWKGEKGEALG